jgi:hypothetical protein
MTKEHFECEMNRAETFRRITSDPEEQSYFAGLVRGLRRAYHGENFGTIEEHEKHMNILEDDLDVMRRAWGEGYRAGIGGTS